MTVTLVVAIALASGTYVVASALDVQRRAHAGRQGGDVPRRRPGRVHRRTAAAARRPGRPVHDRRAGGTALGQLRRRPPRGRPGHLRPRGRVAQRHDRPLPRGDPRPHRVGRRRWRRARDRRRPPARRQAAAQRAGRRDARPARRARRLLPRLPQRRHAGRGGPEGTRRRHVRRGRGDLDPPAAGRRSDAADVGRDRRAQPPGAGRRLRGHQLPDGALGLRRPRRVRAAGRGRRPGRAAAGPRRHGGGRGRRRSS